MLKILSKLITFLAFLSISLNCYSIEILGSYGVGFPSGKIDSSIKSFNIYLRDDFNSTFFQQATLVYLQDFNKEKENNHYTLGVFYGLGASFILKFIEISGSISVGGITHPDKTYLGGELPQFNEVAMINIIDDTSHKKIGISYSHISSAGFAGANQGRDIISMVIGYKF